jgi:tRNA-splicing ligase RtcB
MAHSKNKTTGYGNHKRASGTAEQDAAQRGVKRVAIVGNEGLTPAVVAALSRGSVTGTFEGTVDYDVLADILGDAKASKLTVRKPTHIAHALDTALIFDWTGDIQVEEQARQQIDEVARLPFVKRIAVMPDCHYGMGATIGTVIETQGALIPAAVGVDIGCGITAFPLNISSEALFGREEAIRTYIQEHIPNGRTTNVSGKFDGVSDLGKWGTKYEMPDIVLNELHGNKRLATRYEVLIKQFVDLGIATEAEIRHPFMEEHLGTLGTGNHFIEIVEDGMGEAWILVHSGSRGAGAKLANWAMKRSKQIAESYFIDLPNKDLAYFAEGTPEFTMYLRSLEWAVDYAKANRWIMTMLAADAVEKFTGLAVNRNFDHWTNTSHNYVEKTGRGTWITRKGASKAVVGEYSVMPGSMGAKSYLVEGKSNSQSLFSCSHGAGRAMSRTAARKAFTLDDLVKQTEGLYCRKDEEVLDETRDAYKSIDEVLAQQDELVSVVRTFKAIINVKG